VVQDLELPAINARRSTALVVLGLFGYFAYLSHLGLSEVSASLAQVNLAVFGLAFLLSLLDVVFNALSWKTLVRELEYRISLLDVFLIYMSSIFLNNLIPSGSVSGETARLYFLSKIAGNARIDYSTASVAATRIITAIPFVLGMSVGLAYLILWYEVPSWALTTCFSMIFLMVSVGALFVGICFSESWLSGAVNVVIDQVESLSKEASTGPSTAPSPAPFSRACSSSEIGTGPSSSAPSGPSLAGSPSTSSPSPPSGPWGWRSPSSPSLRSTR